MGLEVGLGWGKSYTKNLPEGEGLAVLLKSFMSHEGSWYHPLMGDDPTAMSRWSLADLRLIERWKECDRTRIAPSLPGLETPSCLGSSLVA